MIKHIVMWKIKEEAEGKTKKENLLEVKKLLESLPQKIAEIQSLEVGISVDPLGSGYDLILSSTFDDLDSLEKYQQHPEHIKVSDFIGKVRSERAFIDYSV